MSRTEAFNAGTTPGSNDMPMEHYGVAVIPGWQERAHRKFHPSEPVNRTRPVPVEQIRAGQSTVEHDKVQQYARGPHQGTLTGVELPDNGGVMLEDGHHRLAAAKLRGDRSLPVHIRTRIGPRYPGTEGRW